jgi:transcriptional regulator with XRE-family HTH domain
MSQEKLGEAIGLTFQQVQKYERGSNRISAGTLYRLGQVLDVPVSFFFDGFSSDHPALESCAVSPSAFGATETISRRDARLLRLWRAAPPAISDEILALLSTLSPQLADGTVGEPQDIAPEPKAAAKSSAREAAETPNGALRRQRRRHGAIWDPADIYNTARPSRK